MNKYYVYTLTQIHWLFNDTCFLPKTRWNKRNFSISISQVLIAPKTHNLKGGLKLPHNFKCFLFNTVLFFSSLFPFSLSSVFQYRGKTAKKGAILRRLNNAILPSPKFRENKLGDTMACLTRLSRPDRETLVSFPLYSVQRTERFSNALWLAAFQKRLDQDPRLNFLTAPFRNWPKTWNVPKSLAL